jgi:hypothetical protein
MKKYWIVLLSLGLLAAFSIPAFAVDVKFSGEYKVFGWYDDNPTLLKRNTDNAGTKQSAVAFFSQRLRIQTDFKVAEGLILTTRFDALEKKWGDATWSGSTAYQDATASRPQNTESAAKTQENIEFERAYLTFVTGIGAFQVGYQNFTAFGPDPGNSSTTWPGIKYILPIGDLTFLLALEKRAESSTPTGIGTTSDADGNVYDLGVIYKFGAGDAGVIIQKADAKMLRPVANVALEYFVVDAYVRATFGPVYFEVEPVYIGGDYMKFDSGTTIKAEGIMGFAQVRVNLNPVYVGAYLGYAPGDDINTADKKEGGWGASLSAGSDFKPCLMLYNDDYARMFARTGGTAFNGGGIAALGSYMDNIWFTQVYVGVKPTAKLDIKASYTSATADKDVVQGQVSKNYGQEIDLTATYKIYDNLEYMIGGAYFITGDYFKGASSSTQIDNDYLLLHRLTLTF